MPKVVKVINEQATTRSAEDPPQKTIAEIRLEEKIQQRRFHWHWNVRLLSVTIAVAVVVLVISVVSYLYHSNQAASTFLYRADAAAKDNDFPAQVKWLSRYSLLAPNDHEAIVRAAVAADNGANFAKPELRGRAIDQARKQLSTSIARLGITEEDDPTIRDLRSRLIKRLLQLGGPWYREAERQVILLEAAIGDPDATRWLALALDGQVNESMYQQRPHDKYEREQDYWLWLSQQHVGEVLAIALKANSTDLDLIARFVNAAQTSPDLFAKPDATDESGKDESDQALLDRVLRDRVDAVVQPIQDNDDSRSQLIRVQIDLHRGNEAQANKRLRAAAALASKRLTQEQASIDAIANEESSGTGPTDNHAGEGSSKGVDQVSAAYWDYVLLLQAAITVADDDAVLAAKWYDRLMALRLADVPASTRETVFVSAGRLSLMQGDSEQAIEIWHAGLEQGNSNSLDLLGSLATVLTQDEDLSVRANAVVDEFRKAISTASTALTRATVSQMSPAQRTAVGRRITMAAWRLEVMDAMIAARRGDTVDAIRMYQHALDASSDASINEKVAVATQLASLYTAEGVWDQAAAVLQKGVDLDPGNAPLRAQAAEAWTRAGNRLQAVEQWRMAGLSASPAMQIASVEGQFNYQLRLPPEQRDFSGVRSKVKRIRDQLQKLEASTDQTTLDVMARDELARAIRRLDVLEVSLPITGVAAEEHLRSTEMADGVANLATKHTTDATIQAFAAERLAEAGRDEEAKQAVERLQEIVGFAATPVAIVQARIEASKGDPLAASKRLLTQVELITPAESEPTPSDEATIDSLRMLAAEFAARANDPELAYESLRKIPEDRRSLSITHALAGLAKGLPEDSSLLTTGNNRLTPDELSLFWEEQLRKQEGETGSYWRFLRITRLIDQLRSDPNEIDRDDRRLNEARTLLREILSWRPRWGEAISLEGWLLAIENRSEQAVERLRRGIEAGDRRLQTRQLLFEQLIRLNREAEAEEELRLTSFATEADVDKYATTKIQLAQRQGDFNRSLAVAEAAVAERPDDYLSHLVLCMTATVAASESKEETQRDELLDQASKAIATAEKLAETDESSIFSARLRLHLARGDKQGIQDEITRIDSSSLDEFTKLMLKAQSFVAIEDFEAALPLLKEADNLRPSLQTQLALVQLYRKLNREDDAIASLRTAQSRSPENAELRNELARAIAARDGASVDWNELSALLSSSVNVTASNRLLYAVLLGAQGDEQQQSKASQMLRELVKEQNSQSDDAARFLAELLVKRAEALPENQVELRDRWFDELRSIYESLVQKSNAKVTDLYRYATFLLDHGQEPDLPKVENLLKQLESMKEGTLAALEISVRYAGKMGEQATSPQLVKSWADRAFEVGMLEEVSVASIAGGTLLKLGFTEEGVQWFKRAYEIKDETLLNYVVALNQADRAKQSIEVCAEHFKKHSDVLSATLFMKSMLHRSDATESTRDQELIENALSMFGDNPALVESVATLRMQQGRLDEAITLYRKVQRLDPLRILALNNLAMALSETPGRAAEGLDPINDAIKLAGENPELLDTKGVVLLKAGRLSEASGIFEQAIAMSSEPRFQFHLIVALVEQGKQAEAEQAWKSLDLEKLDLAGLTANEQEKLATMKQDFGL
ncbi:hypothetical protein [Novipirellula sp.]|uniref:hypothetical protein n=1 Tax=Novipirellula sp. TaxID=2795430 RepID=UPI0035699DC9